MEFVWRGTVRRGAAYKRWPSRSLQRMRVYASDPTFNSVVCDCGNAKQYQRTSCPECRTIEDYVRRRRIQL